jgi:eukaryotic-like serine/threonine-protein kinase
MHSVAVIEHVVAGRYRIVGRIAAGGMGEVFRADDDVLGREVAIKVLHPQYAGDRGFVERFRREARAAAVLNHPNIVGVYDWGVTENTYFMVMEFVRGHSLRTILSRHGPLEPAQAAEAGSQVLAALDHAHGHGIVHRDIKPENILATADGLVKVADFGLARAFADSTVSQVEGTVTGTVQYLAPEQIEGRPTDPRTDLYATGVVLFELLTGTAPYTGETSVAIAYRHLNDRVPAPSSRMPSVPREFDAVVHHATEKDPKDRPQSARTMREELLGAARTARPAQRLADIARQIPAAELQPVQRAPTVTIPRAYSRKVRRRKRIVRAAIVLLTVMALAAGTWASWVYAIPHYTFVPAGLAGLTPAQVGAKLDEAGLHGKRVAERSSLTVAPGLLLATQPGAGKKLRKGQTVSLIYSSGLATVAVTKVTGKTQGAAIEALRAQHFGVAVKKAYDDSVTAGLIISQDPQAGAKLLQKETVTIVVSRGPRPIMLDDYSGQPYGVVKSALEHLQLSVAPSYDYSTSIPAGDVISTDPPAGSVVHHGDTVSVLVSLGPRTFPLPSVIGLQRDQAVSELERDGLKVNVVQIPGSSGSTVVSTFPGPGTTVRQGMTIQVYIA